MRENVNEKVSVIVPVFNVEEYLTDCIESILHQTYSNLEIILVDDGSTDQCPQICDLYAAKDERIKVIHKENGGLADARNAGVKAATGAYIAFLDSDDYIDKDMYRILVSALQENDADIAVAKWQAFEKEPAQKKMEDDIRFVLNGKEVLDFLILGKDGYTISPSVWDRIYKREVIDGFQFPVGKCYEDLLWTTQVFERAERCVYLNRTLYFYRQRDNSITKLDFSERQGVSKRILTDQIPQLEAQIQYLREIDRPELADECIYHLYELLLKYYCTVLFQRDSGAKRFFLSKLKQYRAWGKAYCKKKTGAVRRTILWSSIYMRGVVTTAFAVWMKIRRRK
ncbi:MAG: glycosyltransferase [Clostridiales bacterium]|nr:glycosyltransferase [Clostridiales bacterium]